MPTKKEKQRLKELKSTKARGQQAAAQKAGLQAMRAKLAAGAKASSEAGESVHEILPPMSVRQRKALKNRTAL
jgi:hypothetical protein